MNNNIQSNVNFNGAFLMKFPKNIPGMREGFERNLGKNGKAIYENFNGKKDEILYVLRDSKDYDVAHFIDKNGLRFRYMPEVNTKLRFDYEEDAINYINENKPTVISRIADLRSFIASFRTEKRANYTKDIVPTIIDKLKIFMQNPVRSKDSRAITCIKDVESDAFVKISPANQYGNRFVLAKEKGAEGEYRRYAFDKDGNIIKSFNDVDEFKLFREKFKEAISYQCNVEKSV